jgi:hypothetical protein
MDYRAKLQAGLEEKKIQDREQNESPMNSIKPKPVQNKNAQSNKNSNVDNKSTTTTSTKPKNNYNNNNNNNNNNNYNNNFGNKRGNQSNTRVNYEGLTKLCVITDKKHFQVLRALALYLGPDAFASISSTCHLLENFARNNCQRHLYKAFPLGYQQVTFKVLVDIEEKRDDAKVNSTVSASTIGKQNSVMNHWKDLLRLGENEENGFNKALVPEFAGGVAIGTFNEADTEKSYFVKTAELLSLQSFIDLAVRLINASGADSRQTLPYINGSTLSFCRYGLGGEKLIISVKEKNGSASATHVVTFDQFCLKAYIAAAAYLDLANKFIAKQQATNVRFEQNLEAQDKQKEKLSLLTQRFKPDSLQQSTSTLKKLLKSTNIGFNYFRGQEKKGGPVENKKQQVTASLVHELMQNDQNHIAGVQAAKEQAKKMTEEAKAQKEAEAEEKARLRVLQKEAFEREKESRTQILRKRVPGQVDQPNKITFTIPPPDTPEQIKANKEELKALRAEEIKQQEIANAERARKAEEKKARKEEKKLFKEKERASGAVNKPKPVVVVAEVKPAQPIKVVPKQPVVAKPKTPEDIANEKRAAQAEKQAESHRQKKKQVELAKMAMAISKAEAKKELQANTIAEAKPVKEKKVKAPKFKNKGNAALATRPHSSNTTYMLIGLALLMAVLAYYLFV